MFVGDDTKNTPRHVLNAVGNVFNIQYYPTGPPQVSILWPTGQREEDIDDLKIVNLPI